MEAFAKTSKVIGHDWTVTKNVAGTSYKKKKKDSHYQQASTVAIERL